MYKINRSENLEDKDRKKYIKKEEVSLKREGSKRKALKKKKQRMESEGQSKQRCHMQVCFCAPVWQAPMSQWCYRTDAFWVLSGEMSPNQQSCVSNKGRENALCYQAHINICGDITQYWKSMLVTEIKSINTQAYEYKNCVNISIYINLYICVSLKNPELYSPILCCFVFVASQSF